MGMYFEVIKTQGDDKEWHARLRSDNERIVFWTQNYESERDARHACKVAKREALIAKIPKKGKFKTQSEGSPIGDEQPPA